MTVDEFACRNRQTIDRIQNALRVDTVLSRHADRLQVSKSDDAVVVTGSVPDQRTVAAIIPMIRRAGVVDRVENRVDVA